MDLLDEISEIIKRNQKEINQSGKGFNLISLLGMEEKETKTHSNIIAELLDKNGSHTYGNKFLQLFLEQVGIKDFDINNYQVLREEYVGAIECSDNEYLRTFLDIVIKDKTSGKVILIENKIWAQDQFEQLERYYDCYKGKIIKLFYLNVFEWDYNFKDLEAKDKSKFDEIMKVYQKITYETEIKNWLANCIVSSLEKPLVNKQIEAYFQIILKLTQQDIYKKMNKEMKDKILASAENFETAVEISEVLSQINKEIQQDFFNKLAEKIPLKDNFTFKNFKIFYTISEVSENRIFLGFQMYDDKDVFIETDNHFNDKFNDLRLKFSDNYSNGSNGNWNGWFFMSNKSLLSHSIITNLSPQMKIEFYKNMDKEVELVYHEFSNIINELKTLLSD